MLTEDRRSDKKRQDPKRGDLSKAEYETGHSETDSTSKVAILWTHRKDEREQVSEDCNVRLCAWTTKQRKTKEEMDGHDRRRLRRAGIVNP